MIDHVRCEVFNASYEPLSIVSGRRGLVLVLKGKATIIREHSDYMVNSGNDIHALPAQIVLKDMVKARQTTTVPAVLTQKNMFIRDRWTCVYCNRHRSELKDSEFLTRDHVVPQSKGGPDKWTNVVTACNKCNNKKADLSLADSGLTLRNSPHVPTVFEIWAKASSNRFKMTN